MALNEQHVEQIVQKVVERLMKDQSNDRLAGPATIPKRPVSKVVDGVFEEIEECIQAALKAQGIFHALPLETRKTIIQAIRDVGMAHAEEYGRLEFQETGLGKLEDNVRKNVAACRVMGTEDVVPEVFSGDRGLTLIERIPVGVIASINPVTNAVPTILFNAVMMLAGGNAVVNNPHPKTREISARVIRDLNRSIQEAGGPPNCISCLVEPTVPSAQYLMTHPQIGMIAVTGGHAVVAFAKQTGKRVVAGGPGNPPVVVDETADLERAARHIIEGTSFSNCIACSSEKEIFVVDSAANRLKELLRQLGAHEITMEQGEQLVGKIFDEVGEPGQPGKINMDFIGRTPSFILKSIDFEVGPEAKIVILETDFLHPLVWTEQMMPVLPLVRCPDVDTAIDRAIAVEQGYGHTMAMHSNSLEAISKMASRARCASFVKNGSCGLSSIGVTGEGYTSLHIATNGDGHTRPRVFTFSRRCVLNDDFRFRYGQGLDQRA